MQVRRALVFVSSLFLVAGASAQTPPASVSSAPTPAPAAPQAAPASQAADVVRRVQAFYDKTSTFRADFAQEFEVRAYNKRKTSRGRVTFAKPGKMEWTYDEPKDNKVVSDGALLRVYEAQNKQMFEQAVDKSQYPAALSFLTGQGKLPEHFTFDLYLGDQMRFNGGYVLVGTPKTPNPAYTKVYLYVDAQTYQVRRVLILDGQGNKNRFDFQNPHVNETVAEAQFHFVPPPGTTIVRP